MDAIVCFIGGIFVLQVSFHLCMTCLLLLHHKQDCISYLGASRAVKDVIYSNMGASTAGSVKHKYEFHVTESLFGRQNGFNMQVHQNGVFPMYGPIPWNS